MKTATYNYILNVVQQDNILPVTSSCTAGCIFCSHKNNPQGIDVYRLPDLSFDDIVNMAEFLDKNRKIVIGESASRIIEGEPFIRKDMLDIIKYVRKKYPGPVIEITTGGHYLDSSVIECLKECAPIELNISLNSVSERGRVLLHRGIKSSNAVEAVKCLKISGIPFHGSIVAMPDIVGYKDIEDTISFLCENGADTVRVFVPGFSGLAHYAVDIYEIRSRLMEMSQSLYSCRGVPVLVEPPEIGSLEPEVCGVIKGSPAEKCGIERYDVIRSVDGHAPLTRVDAYERIYKAAYPDIEFARNGRVLRVTVDKEGGKASGAVFYYDIHPNVIHDIDRAVRRYRSMKPVVITSELGYPIIRLGLDRFSDCDAHIQAIKNRWFGGSIKCAGLMVVEDIIHDIMPYIDKENPDLIIVPSAMFDANCRDLAGSGFDEIAQKTGIRAVMV